MPAPSVPFSPNETRSVSTPRTCAGRRVLHRGVSKPRQLSAPLCVRLDGKRKGWARLLSHLMQNRHGVRAGLKSLGRTACRWAT